ncbi:MAG: archaellin/type IV pilin N-terminal domain-containing protein [Candidatus Bathyarchaeia archaeon]|jgi:uncharacterized repeat protein (TIGR02543 family)
MRKITQVRRTVRAISPVISVLLMIAIAVAASLVAYAWVSGYMDFTTTKVGKSIQIQSISPTAVYVQNVGDSPVTIAEVYVDGNLESGYTITVDGTATADLGKGQTATIDYFASPLPRVGNQATIKVVTTDGISAEYKETFSGGTTGGTTSQYSITVTMSPSSVGGDVTADPLGPYTLGDVVTLTPSANSGYTFSGWSGDGVDGTGDTRVVTVTGNMDVTASFLPDVTRAQTRIMSASVVSTDQTTFTFNSAPQAGDLLVVVAGHRQGDPYNYHAPTCAGWILNEVEWYSAGSGDVSQRRIVAVFSKIAEGSSDQSMTIDWNDAKGDLVTAFGILQEFSGGTSFSYVSSGGDSTDGSSVMTDTIPASALSDGSNDNVLAVAGMAWRGGVSNPSFSGLGGVLYNGASGNNDIAGASAFAYTSSGVAVTQTTVTWGTSRMSSGLLVLFACN